MFQTLDSTLTYYPEHIQDLSVAEKTPHVFVPQCSSGQLIMADATHNTLYCNIFSVYEINVSIHEIIG